MTSARARFDAPFWSLLFGATLAVGAMGFLGLAYAASAPASADGIVSVN